MISRKNLVVPEFYQGYVNALTEDELMPALQHNAQAFTEFLRSIPLDKIDYAYAPGKWTIRQLFQHVIDTERVFVYRALSFARKDSAHLPGFDEQAWAATTFSMQRKWDDMIREFAALREATILFFASLDQAQLQQTGTANNSVISVGSLGFICAGHVAHHMRVIKERYLA
jgi:hypothetical protein